MRAGRHGVGRDSAGRHGARRFRAGRLGAVALVVALGSSSLAAVSAAQTTKVSTCATLGTGAIGPAVAAVQQLVKATPDGEYGPLTAAAVSKWQKRHHLPRTGVVDAATWQALPADVAESACSSQVHGSGVAPTCAVLATGARGPAVAVLQRKLGVDADGDFGPVTSAALKTAQTKAKLRASGKAGPATWAALGLTGTPACMTAVQPTAAQKAAAAKAAAAAQAQQVIRDQVAKLAAALIDAPGTSTNPVALGAMSFAGAQKGKPYRWGATGPAAYDCSGLVMASYLAAGITLPRVAADQYGAGPVVPLDQAQQGDLLFYASDLTKPSTIYHVVLYAGGGNVLDAPHTGATVSLRPLWTSGLLPVAVRPAAQLTLPLAPGASGWSVAQLQQSLNRHGALVTVDGGFGPQTAAAVKAWKSAHKWRATATVGVRVWLSLGG
ncbi:MAG TPA: peptidoglycan-binding protein [Mycobacteriales bacterium]|nr:peptidoglycan-binding protein [Mycobacteriales bacterium]